MRSNHPVPDIPVSSVIVSPELEAVPITGASVLVATCFDEASAVALRRGQQMARILDARLVVLHVVPPQSWIHVLFPQEHTTDARAMQDLLVEALDTTRSWCEDVLGPLAAEPTIILKRDHVARAILEAASELHASVIVLGDSPGSSGGLLEGSVATSVIYDAHSPVLIAREERPNHEIVAATDFSDAEYPALQQAARLGVRLGARVTFMHNVDASDYMAAASIFGLPITTTVLPREPDLARRKHELEGLAHDIGTDIATAVVLGAGSAAAILDAARTRDADLVVVGARRRSRMAGRLSPGTAVTVARRARRSVLTVPLHGREPSGWSA